MAKQDNMTAKLAAQSAKRKAELAATVSGIKGEEPAPVVEEPKKVSKAAPVAAEDGVAYEAKRGRKAKYQPKDPRHPTTIVFTESQYRRLKKYAFDHDMGISDVLIEAFAQMTGED